MIINPKRKELLIKGAIVIAFLSALSKHTRGAESLGYIYPVIFIILIGISFKEIVKIKEYRILLILNTIFALWAAATSLWSEYPMASLSRSAAYWLVTTGGIVSAYLWSKESKKFNLNLLVIINAVVVLLALVRILFKFPSDAWSGGNGIGLMSFFAHQNTLGALILFTAPALFMLIKAGRKKSFVYPFLISLFALSIIVLIATYSRASVFSLYFFFFLYAIMAMQWKFVIVNILLIAAGASLYFLFNNVKVNTDKIILKNFNTVLESRDLIWKRSYEAAKLGGISGLGYGISHPDVFVSSQSNRIINGRMIREKGSSVLALIEETGLVGLVLFFSPLFYVLRKSYSTKRSSPGTMSAAQFLLRAALCAMLFALLLHAQVEAWMVGVGSIFLSLFFFYNSSLLNLYKL